MWELLHLKHREPLLLQAIVTNAAVYVLQLFFLGQELSIHCSSGKNVQRILASRLLKEAI